MNDKFISVFDGELVNLHLPGNGVIVSGTLEKVKGETYKLGDVMFRTGDVTCYKHWSFSDTIEIYIEHYFYHTNIAIGIAEEVELLTQYPDDWERRLGKLSSLNWSRSSTELWEGRAMLQGKMSAAQRNVILTANILKQTLGLTLQAEEQQLEEQYMQS